MRFFSNEAKENADDREVPGNENDRFESDGLPAPVPQQRVGSPWSDAPGNTEQPSTEAEPADQEARAGTVESPDQADAPAGRDEESLRRDDSEVRHGGDDLVRDDAPRHDDDLDLPLDDRSGDDHAGSHRAESDRGGLDGDDLDRGGLDGDDLDRAESERAESERGESERAGAEGVAADHVDDRPGAEQQGGTTTTYQPDGTITTVDEPAGVEGSADEKRDLDEAAPVVATAPVETAASEPGTGDHEAAPAVDGAAADGAATDGSAVDRPAADGAAVDSAAVDGAPVDGTAGDSAVAGGTAAAAAGTGGSGVDEPVPATDGEAATAVPVGAAETATAAKPNPSASPVGDKLFADGESYTDRLRDIALNFVDDPKEATQQAGALVDEAIDKVTSALKAQKDALAGEGDDTERLRVELRGYRDILKRISSL